MFEQYLQWASVLHAGPRINAHLSLLFNSMMRHCFVPSEFCMGIIHSLLKNKHGDATDINMYRGVTISPVISKVFESLSAVILIWQFSYQWYIAIWVLKT